MYQSRRLQATRLRIVTSTSTGKLNQDHRHTHFKLKKKEWETIKALNRSNKLQKTWTELFYKRFRRINPCCTLIFRYQHLKPKHSQKKQSPFLKVKASCSLKSWEATYIFTIQKRPSRRCEKIYIYVTRVGDMEREKWGHVMQPIEREGKLPNPFMKE